MNKLSTFCARVSVIALTFLAPGLLQAADTPINDHQGKAIGCTCDGGKAFVMGQAYQLAHDSNSRVYLSSVSIVGGTCYMNFEAYMLSQGEGLYNVQYRLNITQTDLLFEGYQTEHMSSHWQNYYPLGSAVCRSPIGSELMPARDKSFDAKDIKIDISLGDFEEVTDVNMAPGVESRISERERLPAREVSVEDAIASVNSAEGQNQDRAYASAPFPNDFVYLGRDTRGTGKGAPKIKKGTLCSVVGAGDTANSRQIVCWSKKTRTIFGFIPSPSQGTLKDHGYVTMDVDALDGKVRYAPLIVDRSDLLPAWPVITKFMEERAKKYPPK